MSGTPKYCSTALSAERALQIALERANRAQEEARQRAIAAEQERQRRLEAHRAATLTLFGQWNGRMEFEQGTVFDADRRRLVELSAAQEATVESAQNTDEIQSAAQELSRIQEEWDSAATAKRQQEEAEHLRSELERLSYEFTQVEQKLARVAEQDGNKFDARGRFSATSALDEVRRELANSQPEDIEQALRNATTCIEAHQVNVRKARNEWLRRKAAAERAADGLAALLQGLRSDPLLTKWQDATLNEIQSELASAQQAISDEEFEQPAAILAAATTLSEEAVREANACQIRADQRDYIASSIASTLSNMGFYVSGAREENPGVPDTPIVLAAQTTTGKSIHVSVPTKGEVWYNVEGFPMSTESTVGGGSAAVCDEAERVLDEMREQLGEVFGVEAGEIEWEGKDPNRTLSKKQVLPRSDNVARENAL